VKRMGLKELIIKALSSAQQEMVLTLPSRLLMAFEGKLHERELDPQTAAPFASFYRWLWVIGLQGSAYLDAQDIIRQLQRNRERMPEGSRSLINELIEDLVKGHGAAQPRGGDRRSKKSRENQSGSTPALNGAIRKHASKSPASLAARMAESADPQIHAAWEDHLAGRHRTVTAAAIACGMIADANAPLARLKQNWKRATAAERRAFLKFISEESA